MDPDGVVREVLEELEGYADQARRKKAGTYHPISFKVLGVPVPDQRKITNALISKMKGAAADEKLSMALVLVRTGIFECQQVAYEMLSRDGRTLSLLTLEDLLELRKGFDNWISVDTWSTYLAGVAWREGRIPDDVVIGWTTSTDPWVRRSALVCTIPLNQISRGGKGDPDRTLMICGKLMRDRDRMVRKALSWALRELSKRDSDAVRRFVGKNRDILPPGVIREVERKLTTGRKDGAPEAGAANQRQMES